MYIYEMLEMLEIYSVLRLSKFLKVGLIDFRLICERNLDG